ncbi:MAG: TlpA family protein disulfide reductase [Planctomycetaceae bacterium]|nr:TlpA family protein disulfide reductase [Planctomycetaceae bacterium]
MSMHPVFAPARILCTGLLAAALLTGCGGKTEETTGSSPDSAGTPTGQAGTAERPLTELTGEVQLEVATWEELQQKIAEQNGKVVVLDVWASWCAPCKKEFPGLVRLQQQFPDSVVAMSVNLDYEGSKDNTPESFRDSVMPFLEEVGAKFPNFLFGQPSDEFYELAEIDAPPTVLVYDQNGTLHKKVDVDSIGGGNEEVSYQKHVVPVVEKLLSGE